MRAAMAVEIPQALRELLEGAKAEAPVLALADAVGTLLGDNEMPFFPGFTDHGSEHLDRVLEAGVALIPKRVWKEELLHPADAAALASAAMLHDLAMHVREPGFVELVEGGDFEPQPWFDVDQPGRTRDLPWRQLWSDFQREARHFGTSQLELLLGPGVASCPTVAFQEQLDPSQWKLADRLLIGEFLRRHHARLAHEIAVYGFPGARPEDFPVLSGTLPELANAIGALARSHGEDLRAMLDYVRFLEPRNKRPEGVLLVYLMGLLRVADYLQIDADRAPPLLLRLKKPQSRLSLEEWSKHKAISSITDDSDDPYGISVTVSRDHGLRTHLALVDLFEDMQLEMDTSVAVIDEVYGRSELGELGLTRRRVVTNLDQPSLHRHLNYVPRRAALRSDPDLFRLVIRDLYGNQPAVAGRELIQNAVDAVRVRRAHEKATDAEVPEKEFRALDADVVVTVEEGKDGRSLLRIADRGVGMTPDLIVDYFLQAGASFGPVAKEFADESSAPMKAGRFGVGAFAAFLLGPEMRVKTRHVDEKRGIAFRARIDEDLVELDWADLPIGTEVEIPFEAQPGLARPWGGALQTMPQRLLSTIIGFYRLKDPSVCFIYRGESEEAGEIEERPPAPADVPSVRGKIPDLWRSVRGHGMDAVFWRVPPRSDHTRNEFHAVKGGLLAHNGIVIRDLDQSLRLDEGAYSWSDPTLGRFIRRPSLAVFDRKHALHVKLHRYGLVDRTLPFEDCLLESLGTDLVAHALVAGPEVHPLQSEVELSPIFSRTAWIPASLALLNAYVSKPLLLLWTVSRGGSRPGETNPGPDPQQFLALQGSLNWRKYRFRAHIPFTHAGHGSQSEYDEWGFSIQSIASETSWLAASVPAAEAYTVMLRDSEEELFVAREGSLGMGVVPDEFRQTAEEVREKAGTRWVVLTLLKHLAVPGEQHLCLAAPWKNTVGGALPRSARRKNDVAERILAEHPSLRPLVDKWRRTIGSRESI
jgi:molecular chaperone HtpG